MGLEHRGGIAEPKLHAQVLVMPQLGVKSRLPLVPLPNPDQVLSVLEVELGEDVSSLQEFEGRV